MSVAATSPAGLRRALDPANGLARAATLHPPEPPTELLWRMAVLLEVPHAPAVGQREAIVSSAVVGAYGLERNDVVVRAVGEAVERRALVPSDAALPGAVTGRRADLPGSSLDLSDAASGLADPAGQDRGHVWYPARQLRTGATVYVPAGLVDHPVPADVAAWFDASPSGAASGIGAAAAQRTALLEVVERDAFMVAWERSLRLRRIDVEAWLVGGAAGGSERHRRSLERLLRLARGRGLEVVLADLPVGVPGLACTVGVVLDDAASPPTATVGCNATDDVAWSMLGAVQEALQVRSIVRRLVDGASSGEPPTPSTPLMPPSGPPRDDGERIRHLCTARGDGDVRAWVEGFSELGPPRRTHPVSDDELVAHIVADGGDPLVVDLTVRVPPALADQGWSAVKVVPVGFQPLRMDDSRPWSWNRARLATVEARTGRPCAGLPQGARPHPLP